MRIHVNDEEREVPEPLSLSGLLDVLGLRQDRVAVELNRSVVLRADWARIAVSEGDRIEIVHFVGGG